MIFILTLKNVLYIALFIKIETFEIKFLNDNYITI